MAAFLFITSLIKVTKKTVASKIVNTKLGVAVTKKWVWSKNV